MANILDALYNAQMNLVTNSSSIARAIGAAQLKNAIALIEKGYPIYSTDIEEVAAKYGSIEAAPDYNG